MSGLEPSSGQSAIGLASSAEALVRLAREIAAYRTVADLLAHLDGHLRPLFPEGVGIVLHDPEAADLYIGLAFGADLSRVPPRVPVDYGPAGWVWQEQQPRTDILTAADTHPTLQVLFEAGIRSMYWFPLSTPRVRLGTFAVARRTVDPIPPDLTQLVAWVVDIVGLALEHLTQVESLERLGREVSDERDRAQVALHALAERVKELTALHQATRLLDDRSLDIGELLRKIAGLVPPALQYPESAGARVRYGDTVVETAAFDNQPAKLSAPFATRDGVAGAIEVIYLDDRPASAEGPFLQEERHLVDSLAELLETALDKRAADTALRVGEQHLRAARDRAGLLLEITNAVVSELDLKRLLNAISHLLTEKIRHHFVSISLWDEAEQRLRRHALVFPTSRGTLEEGRLVAIGSPADLTFRRGKTAVFSWTDVAQLGEPSVSVMTLEGLRVVCCVPLTTARGRYGTLNVGKPNEGDAFPPDEVELLEQVARQLAIAFENALNFRSAERYRQESIEQRDRLQLLLDINNQLLAQPESHARRLSVLSMARRFVGHDYAALVIWDEEAGELRIEANTYYDGRGVLEPHLSLPVDLSPSGKAFKDERARMFTGEELDRFEDEGVKRLRADGLRSLCCVPLITQRGVLGTLTVGRRAPDGFSPAEVTLLGDVAGQVAIAVANTLAYQQISALTDRLTEEKLYLEDEISSQHDFTQIVGSSHALTSVLHQVRTVAPTDATVLLLGETGTGKELLARALHDASRRRGQTFVRVNGAALPANLIESELFGYEKGAFTGATSSKVGRLELAHRGTLFLDEVGDLPLDVQPKLLRALQEQEFERLGSTRTQKVDVRLIAATNRHLSQMVAEGTFRSDLYYRLSVFPIFVPPLRERPEDIAPLVHHFVRKFSREIGRPIATIAAASMDALQKWIWPGNIRELENVIERAVILSSGSTLQVPPSAFQGTTAAFHTTPQAMPPTRLPASGAAAAPPSADAPYRDGEREMILKALREAKGIISGPEGAAARLGLKRTTLHSKMRKLGIARPSF